MNNQDKTVRRSKIYTYFYGRKTVFQQFLLIVGALLILLAGVASNANCESYYNKLEKLRTNMNEAEEVYYEWYNEYSNYFNVSFGEPADADNMDEYYIQRYNAENNDWDEIEKDYNKALERHEEAEEKYREFSSKSASDSAWAGICRVLGYITVGVGVIWFIYKKISFNKDGEKEYDEEIRDLIAQAKEKGMEKLNIVAEQINMVEPVVLNGIATTNGNNTKIMKNWLGGFFSGILRFVLSFGVILLGAVANAILLAIAGAIAKNNIVFVIVLVAILALAGLVGKIIYTKFETESYISPRTIKNLEKFYPNDMTKLGSDERVRVSLPAIIVYMFSDDQLYVYTQYVDIVTGKIFYEGVQEFFYEDIVGITSGQEVKKIFKRCGFMNLFLKSIDYMIESISVVTKGCTCNEAYIVDMGNSLLDTQFMGMRNLVRQKKMEK